MDYNFSKYELSSKRCPDCDSLVMVRVVKTLKGVFYRYIDLRCSNCGWRSPIGS